MAGEIEEKKSTSGWLKRKTGFITPVPTGIIPGGMILTGIPNQDLCDFQIVDKIMGTKG